MFQEGIKISKDRFKYFFNWWNNVTAIMLILFFLATVFWIVGVAITGGWSVVNYFLPQFAESKVGYQLLFWGNSFFSMAIVASVFYLFELCQVKSQQYHHHYFNKVDKAYTASHQLYRTIITTINNLKIYTNIVKILIKIQ
jgi:hypothetical protein